MAISTNGLQLVRIAGAAFNQRLSGSDYSEILTANKSAADLDAWANSTVAGEFRNKTTTDIATTVLTNLGLSSVAGLSNWLVGQLNAGGGVAKAGQTLLALLNDFSNMSTTDATYGASVMTFNQKVANSQAQSLVASTATGTYAAVSAVAPAAPNVTLTLTAGVDTTLVGGAGSDTYTATNATLNAGDSLDGGAGTDTLSLTSILPGTYGAGARSTGVENLNVTATIGDATVDASGLVGLTKIASVGSTQAVTVTGLTTIPSLELIGSSNSLTATIAAAAVIGGADSISVALNGAGTTASSAPFVTANGIETINVSSSGSASGSSTSAVNISSDTLTTLNVTGAVAARLSADLIGATALVTGTVTSDDGAHDVTIIADSTDRLSVSMNAGNDTVRVANVAANYTIVGGDGTDTLRYTGATAVTFANTANISGFETVTLSNATNPSFAMAGAGITTLNYTTAGSGTFGGLSTGGSVNLNVGGAVTVQAAGAASTATSAAATTAATYSGAADSLTVNVGLATTSTGVAASTVSAIGVESVTFNSLTAAGGSEARTVTFNDTTATTGATKSLTVSSSGTGVITTVFTPTGTSALTSVNMAGVTGNAVFASGTTLLGVAVTGGAGNDTLTGGAAADTILGGVGNDSLSGGAGVDSIDGGDGADTIVGGTGADVMTGGAGADRFVIGTNDSLASTPVINSTLAAPDTITDFLSGTDKLDVGAVSFLGNFVNIQGALAAQGVTGTPARSAAFVTGENSLYVFVNAATTNTLNANDTVVKLTNVTSLAQGDLLLGPQGSGNSITLSAASAVVATSGAASNAAATTGAVNTPDLSANTTDGNDTVSAVVNFLASSTLTGGSGNDTLALSLASTSAQATVSVPASVTGFEAMTLANYSATSTANNRTYDIALDESNIAANSTLTITSSMTGVSFDGSIATTGVSLTANAVTTATKAINYSGNSAQDSVTGGAGNDTIIGGDGNDSLLGGTGTNQLSGGNGDDVITSGSVTDSIDGGAGNDTVTLITGSYTSVLGGGAGAVDTLSIVASTNLAAATVSGFEVLNISGTNTTSSVTLTSAQLAGFTSGISVTTITTPANITISVDATTTARLGTGAITLDADVQNYTVAASAVGGVTFTSPAAGTYSVTGGAGADVIDLSASTSAVNQTLIGGAGNDTVKLSAATFTASDVVAGGDGSNDVFELTGTGAVTVTLNSSSTGFESIVISGRLTQNASLTADAATNADSTTFVVSTSQTTGALTFSAANETTTSSPYSITGGGGDDVLTGGSGNDTISGGAGGDVILGGIGNDTLISGTGNNNIGGGVGNDTINFTDGGSDVYTINDGDVRATATTIYEDTITGFDPTVDRINIAVGDLDGGGGTTVTLQLSDSAGADVTAARSFAAQLSVAANTNQGTTAANADLIKFTSTTATSFASAIGTSIITLNATNTMSAASTAGETEGMLAVYYNATTSQAIVGILVNTDGTISSFASTDTFIPIALLGMTSTQYGNLGFANFNFIGS